MVCFLGVGGGCVIHCRGPGRRQRLCLQYIFCCALPVIRDSAFAGVRLIAIQSIFPPSQSIPFPPPNPFTSPTSSLPLFFMLLFPRGPLRCLRHQGWCNSFERGIFFSTNDCKERADRQWHWMKWPQHLIAFPPGKRVWRRRLRREE